MKTCPHCNQEIPFKLPAPPEGHQWHRTDWEKDMLPDGTRSLLLEEARHPDDEVEEGGKWVTLRSLHIADAYHVTDIAPRHRTRRPLPSRWQAIRDAFLRGERVEYRYPIITPKWFDWTAQMEANEPYSWDKPSIEFRLAPKLPWDCPEDVPLGCYIIYVPSKTWSSVTRGNENGVWVEGVFRPWKELQNDCWQHSTDRQSWKPCTKPAK